MVGGKQGRLDPKFRKPSLKNEPISPYVSRASTTWALLICSLSCFFMQICQRDLRLLVDQSRDLSCATALVADGVPLEAGKHLARLCQVEGFADDCSSFVCAQPSTAIFGSQSAFALTTGRFSLQAEQTVNLLLLLLRLLRNVCAVGEPAAHQLSAADVPQSVTSLLNLSSDAAALPGKKCAGGRSVHRQVTLLFYLCIQPFLSPACCKATLPAVALTLKLNGLLTGAELLRTLALQLLANLATTGSEGQQSVWAASFPEQLLALAQHATGKMLAISVWESLSMHANGTRNDGTSEVGNDLPA